MDDLAAMLHPWTCDEDRDHVTATNAGGWLCHRAAAAIAPRITPDREALHAEWFRQGWEAGHRAGLAASQPVLTEPEEADRG